MYASVCAAGTFDRIHKGHESLLEKAFSVGERVLIGLTSDVYVLQHKTGTIRPFSERLRDLNAWLDEQGYASRASVVPVDDAVGPAGTDDTLEAIVVSEESRTGARQVNVKRKEAGLAELTVIVVPMVRAEDHRPVSSGRVRNGEIDTTGHLVMPDSMREELSGPLGAVLVGDEITASFRKHQNALIVSVGDRTTQALLDAGVVPSLMVVDHKVNRKEYTVLRPLIQNLGFRQQSVRSGPGFISGEVMNMLSAYFTSPQEPHVIVVDGEEDLLALPAISMAPEGAVVYYGQPGMDTSKRPLLEGVVEVIVTKNKKEEARRLLKRFVSS